MCSSRHYLNWEDESVSCLIANFVTKLLRFPQPVLRLHVSMWRPQTSAVSEVISVCILLSSPHAFFSVQTHLQPCPNASQVTVMLSSLVLMWLLYLNCQYWQGGKMMPPNKCGYFFPQWWCNLPTDYQPQWWTTRLWLVLTWCVAAVSSVSYLFVCLFI